MPENILICEDEPDLASLIAHHVEKSGWRAIVATSGAEALAKLADGADLVILDVNLPDMTGFEICRQIRRTPTHSDTPVMMVSARSDEIDRVVGFEVGADDYVTKPFSVRELVLRVRALLRRATATPEPTGQVASGRLRLDPEGHRLWVDDAEVVLTPIEYRLLLAFVSRPGRACTREDLLARTWGPEHHITERTIDTHVKRLRAKLGPAGSSLLTLRGVGYRWQADDVEAPR